MIRTALLIFPCLFLLAALDPFYDLTEKGNKLYSEGDYNEALKAYQNAQVEEPESPELHTNIGNVFFRIQDFERAILEYLKVQAENNQIQSIKDYNLGRTYLAEAEQFAGHQNLQGAIESLRKSIDATIESLKVNPDDRDAKMNLEYAIRQLAHLEQQQQEQEQQQQQNNQEEDKDQSDESEQQNDSDENQEQEQQQNQQQDREQEPQQQEQQQERQQPSPEEDERMSEEDAMRILSMTEDEQEEKENLKRYLQRLSDGEINVEKDW